MIHYITCHFGTDRMLNIQRKHIEHFTTGEYKIWSSYTPAPGQENNDIISDNVKRKYHHFEIIPTTITNDTIQLQYYKLIPIYSEKGIYIGSWNHQNNLHILTERLLTDKDTKDDDIIIWLDADTFIKNNVNNFLDKQSEKFIAVQRKELTGRNPIYKMEEMPSLPPHPCFAACSVKFWKENKLNWYGCREYMSDIDCRKRKDAYPDTGGYLYMYFNDNNIEWKKMLFTGQLKPHYGIDSSNKNCTFSVYDDIALHVCGLFRHMLDHYKIKRSPNLVKNIQQYKDLIDYILSGEYLIDLKKKQITIY